MQKLTSFSIMQDLTLISHNHQRYENGVPVMGLQIYDRAIIVQNKNFSELFSGIDVDPSEGYLVRMINMDINKDQMIPKLMKMVSDNGNSILLKGVTLKVMGSIISPATDCKDYGLKLILKDRIVVKCILYMYDRNTEIEYNIG